MFNRLIGTTTMKGLLLTAALGLGAGCDNSPASNTQDMSTTPAPDMTTTTPPDMTVSRITKVTGGFEQPESIFWDSASSSWYVSNMSVTNLQNLPVKDNKGWITRISADLKTVDHNWLGANNKLSTPAGIRVVGGNLYVADIDQLVVIPIATPTANPTRSMAVAKAGTAPAILLNDVALDGTAVLAADTFGGRIIRFATPTVANNTGAVLGTMTYKFPNGLYVDGTKLILVETEDFSMPTLKGKIYSMVAATGLTPTQLGTFTGKFDGIEKDGNDYLISDNPTATVYRVNSTTGAQTLLYDFKPDGAMTAADIGYDSTKRRLAVPDTGSNTIFFYDLP
ncbi:MAG: hypothetical protein U1A78_21695 [Polyangia bacterium]